MGQQSGGPCSPTSYELPGRGGVLQAEVGAEVLLVVGTAFKEALR